MGAAPAFAQVSNEKLSEAGPPAAFAGTSKGRPELVDQPLPLLAKVAVVPSRSAQDLLHRLFEPLASPFLGTPNQGRRPVVTGFLPGFVPGFSPGFPIQVLKLSLIRIFDLLGTKVLLRANPAANYR